MKIQFLAALLLLGSLVVAPVQAQYGVDAGSTVSYNHATFQTCFPQIALIISAGCAYWYVDSPKMMAPGRTGVNTSPTSCMAYSGYNNCYHISVTVALDVSPLVSVTIASGAGSSTGCHSQAGSAPAGTTVGFTVSRTFYIGVDEGSIYCRGTLTLVLQTTTGATGIAQVLSQYEFAVPYQDNQVRLCNASEFSTDVAHPDDSSIVYPKRNPCTTPTVNTTVSGSLNVPDLAAALEALTAALCDNPSGHGHCSLDIHGGLSLEQDGTWTIRVENFTSQVDIGNQSVVFPSNLTVAATFPGDVDAPGFDFWALFLFWVLLLGFCLYQGWFFAAAFAIPGVLDGMFPTQIPENFSVWFVFVLLGCIMEVAASKFQWGPYKSKNGMRA